MSLDRPLQEILGKRYTLRRLIAETRMGRVYEAWDERHARPVAVKVASSETEDVGRERFRDEIATVARLQHPSILPVHDSGEVDGTPFFIMPFVESQSLRERIRHEGQLPVAEVLPLLRDLAGALDHAHEHGIIHRDVKPSNVLLESGRAVLADFGVSRLVRPAQVDRDADAPFEGSLRYMSPERIADPLSAEPGCDIYALGCVAYEMLTGERPFEARTGAGVVARKVQGPEAVGKGLPGLPNRVRHVVQKALATLPADRYQRAEAFVDALDEAAAPRRRQWIVIPVLVAAVFVVLSFWPWGGSVTEDESPPLVVVGPVENRTGDPAFDVIVPMVVDFLTRSLQRQEFVRTVPTEVALSAVGFINRRDQEPVADPIGAVARETGASLVVSGALLPHEEGVSFRAQVSDTSDAALVTALEPVVLAMGPREDPGPLLEEAAARVMGALAVETDERLQDFVGAARPPTLSAYWSFNDGLQHYLAGEYGTAIPHFQVAYDEDPGFVTALLYEALSQANLGRFATEDSLLKLAEAFRDDMTVSERYWVDYRRALLRNDGASALAAIRMAADFAPRSRVVYNLAIEAMEARRLREAADALESLPVNRGSMRGFPNHLGLLSVTRHLLGDYAGALDAAEEARELFPDHLNARLWEASSRLALAQMARVTEEVTTLARLTSDVAGWTPGETLVRLAAEYEAHGHEDGAHDVRAMGIELLEGTAERGGPQRLLSLGPAYLAQGRIDDAARIAEQLVVLDLSGVARTESWSLTGQVAAASGDTSRARRIIDDLVAMEEPFIFGLNYRAAAAVATALDEAEEALELLRRGFANRLPYGEWVHNHMAFKALWDLPEYQALIAPIG